MSDEPLSDERLEQIREGVQSWPKPQPLQEPAWSLNMDREVLLAEVDRLRAALAGAKLEAAREAWRRAAQHLDERGIDFCEFEDERDAHLAELSGRPAAGAAGCGV